MTAELSPERLAYLRRWRERGHRAGDIGEPKREWTVEPVEAPEQEPIHEPAAPERVPEREPVPVGPVPS